MADRPIKRSGWLAIALLAALLVPQPGRAASEGPTAEVSARKLPASPHRVFHLNCGTMSPPSSWLVNGVGSLFGEGRLVNHCLLIETSDGLVLVDTGLGEADVAAPARRFSWGWFAFVRPRLAREETARRQIERLGFRAAQVTDIVLTHLDVDHVGGLADFPRARVHLSATEHRRVVDRTDGLAPTRWAHGPRWVTHTLTPRTWYGFASSPLRPGLRPDIRLVGLPGHTPGHVGVAVKQGARWLLHAGDAYYHRDELDGPARRSPPALEAMHHFHGFDAAARGATLRGLRRLARAPGRPVRLVGAHDPHEWAAFAAEGLAPKLAVAGRQGDRR